MTAETAAGDGDAAALGGTESPGAVEVAYALPQRQRVVRLPLSAAGMTAGEAVARSGLLQELPEMARRELVIGIYGAVCGPAQALRDGDRVEIYRPLAHDPRKVRRERARRK